MRSNDMSPVTLPRHFTTDFIMGRIDDDLARAGRAPPTTRIAADKDVVVVEGTGHAGVGAVVGLSNARVAAMLDAPVIIVSARAASGARSTRSCSIARCSRRTACGCSARSSTRSTSSRIRTCPRCSSAASPSTASSCSACIPYSEFLANPSLELIATHLDGELLAGEATPGQTIGWVAIGAMQATHAVELLRDRTLLITPGDREDLVLAAIEANRRRGAVPRVIGIVLTGGFRPPDRVLEALREADIFAYLVGTDTYRTAQAVDEILVKTHASDTEKIATIIELVDGALDVDALLARL